MTSVQTSDKGREDHQAGSELSYLDQALWKRFHEAGGADEFAAAWLTLQCSMLPGVRSGVVVLGTPDTGPFVPIASWPDGAVAASLLGAAADSALGARKGVVNKSEDGACAAYPVLIDDQLHGVAAVDVASSSDAALRGVMRQLQWGCGWLEANLRRQSSSSTFGSATDASLAVELAALALEAERFREAATAVVTELAIRLQCDRVSLGVRDGKHTRVTALSHSAQFGKHSNLTRAIGTAMDEAIDQHGRLLYPQEGDQQVKVDRAHAELAAIGGGRHICTLPLAHAGDLFGALTLDRADGEGFSEEEVRSLTRIAAFLGPVLAIKRQEDRWIGRKVVQSVTTQLGRLLGPRYIGRKLVALLLVGLVAFFTLATGLYRVRASATLEGAIERVTVAPIAGYIAEAKVRAGDVVKEGELLFRIDDRDLRLEYLKWSGQKEQYQRQLRDALAQHERSQVNVLGAQLDQAEAQVTLVGEQIARTRVSAPFDGIVVSGDLSDSLGAPVERGQILFQIAPLNEYRVALQVPETEVSAIRPGQDGQLILSAMPNQALPIQVDSITPVSNAMDGKNTFRVEASLIETPEFLRPGMQGAGRIAIEERKLAWIWTHDLVNWLRIWYWSWWP